MEKPRSKKKKEQSLIYGAGLNRLYRMAASSKIDYIRNGADKKDLLSLKDRLQVDYDDLSLFLSVSRGKLISRKSNEKFDAVTSEKIVTVADLVSYGIHVFEDENRFIHWFKNPVVSLGNKAPIEYIDTSFGIEEVRNALGRIEYGIY